MYNGKYKETSLFSYLVWASTFITIAMTPWANSDSLIIPKLAILFSVGLSLIPYIFSMKQHLLQTKMGKIVFLTIFAIITQLILVVLNSEAPIEQQFFGRTGRGLGLATEFAILVVLLATIASFRIEMVSRLQIGIMSSCFITSIYSIFQKFGFDFFDWVSRTNGIIGTLGNPNFQSSFAAISILPTILYFWWRKNGKLLTIIAVLPSIILIILSESTQGYIVVLASLGIYLICFLWYKNKSLFYIFSVIFIFSFLIILMAILNKGPLASVLYKASVQSRADFFKISVLIANDNPFFGVGLDSLGDNYLKYWNPQITSPIGEFTDNSHNLFLNYASTSGYIMAILQYFLVVLVITSFILTQKIEKKFMPINSSIFAAWIAYQLQAQISPANIAMLVWNAIFSGAIIGLFISVRSKDLNLPVSKGYDLSFIKPLIYFFGVLGLLIIYPLYKVDHMQFIASRSGNGNLAIQSALSFPESSIRYARIGQELIKSNLLPQALELGRSAVEFNPNAPSAWGLILINNYASIDERIKAKNEILRLDPFNKEIRDVNFPPALDPKN